MKITGKYTYCDIFAKTLEDGIYSQIYDIINSKAFKDKKVCVKTLYLSYFKKM